MERRVLFDHGINEPPESEEVRKAYEKWSTTYEKIYADLSPRQQRQLEILQGNFNDLCYEIERQAYDKGMFTALDSVIARFPQLKDQIKEVEDNINY